jgi:multicomponent Na+:H+ antiporter subunit G
MIQEIIGNTLIGISIAFLFIGLFGIFRFESFYTKVLSSSKIDIVAMITLIFGLVIRSGLSWFSIKALLIVSFLIFVNPIITSKIIMSYKKDMENEEEEKE